MIGDLIKKLVPIGIGAAAATIGASALGGSKLWASSALTNKFKEKALGEIMKRGVKGVLSTPSDPINPSDYNVSFDEYLMEVVAASKAGKGSGAFGQLKSEDPEAHAYAWQRRLNSYLKSGDIV